MKRQSLVVTALMLTLAFGLSLTRADEPATRGEKGEILTPMAIGNTWLYDQPESGTTMTDRIEGMVRMDGQPWYLLRMTEQSKGQPDAKPQIVSEYWLTHEAGVEVDATFEIDDETGALRVGAKNLYFRYPATLNEVYHPDASDQSWQVQVIALSEAVKTPAGEFSCIVYQETFKDEEGYSHTSYVAPGVGVVKYVTTDEGETTTGILRQFDLVEENKPRP